MVESSKFIDLVIEFSGPLLNVEAFEYEKNGQSFFRVMGIRESCEVLVWEVAEGQESERFEIFFRFMNSSMNSCLRWPYFAQVLNGDKIIVQALDKPFIYYTYNISKKLELEGRINKMCFSNQGNLYFQFSSGDDVHYHTLKVLDDLNMDKTRQQEVQKRVSLNKMMRT